MTEVVRSIAGIGPDHFHHDFLRTVLFREVRSVDNLLLFCHNDANLEPEVEQLVGSETAVVHLSDESKRHDTRYYGKARVVLRPHYDPRKRGANVWTVPLGYTNGFGHDGSDLTGPRKFAWAFAGAPKADRADMISSLAYVGKGMLHVTSGWFTDDILSARELSEIYSQTIFGPCPTGNISPDSLRVGEVLEWGCIPVVVRFMGIDYFRYVYGDHPFIVGKDWGDAGNRMKALLARPDELAALQEKTRAWYAQFNRDLTLDVADLLAGRTDSLRSPQFAYQREGQADRALRAKFELHFGEGKVARTYRQALRKLRSFATRYA